MAFKAADLASVKIFAGAFITAFALFLLLREQRVRAADSQGERKTAVAFTEKPAIENGVGIVSGAMAVALAMPGSVAVLYLLSRHAGKQISRAATLILFGFSYGAVSCGPYIMGRYDRGATGCWRHSLRPLSWRVRVSVTTPRAISARSVFTRLSRRS